MLTLQNINITLGSGSKLARKVLHQLSLTVNNGEFVVIIGGNGAGKSTVFNIISGTLTPDSGKIFLHDKDITKTTQYQRSQTIAKVMQDPKVGTMENMTVLENLAFAYLRGIKRLLLPYHNTKRKTFFQDKLALLGMDLENRLDERVANLSGGQRQALSLIMAIIANANILLLDEITAALDPKIASKVMNIANHIITETQLTTIMITHNMTHAIKYGHRILLMDNGQFTKEFTGQAKQALTPLILAAEFGEI
jgi:putative ABC transport system ATP-binding protein